jgi:hypothetical protein
MAGPPLGAAVRAGDPDAVTTFATFTGLGVDEAAQHVARMTQIGLTSVAAMLETFFDPNYDRRTSGETAV